MEEKALIICGTLGTIAVNILCIIFAIKAFNTNVFLAFLSIVFCIVLGYFDGLLAKYFINKIKEKKNERKN